MAGEELIIAMLVLVTLTMMMTIGVYANRYKRAPPDQALVVFGRKGPAGANFHVLPPGGAKFILPITESYKMLDVGANKAQVRVVDTLTREGVPATVDLVGVYRISHEPEALKRAASSLLSRSRHDIEDLVLEVVAGAVRTVAVTLTMEQLNADRDAFGARVRELCAHPLGKVGLELVSLTMKDVADQVGYLEALGKRRTAEVKRNAIVAEAAARRDAIAQAAEFDKDGQRIRFEKDVEIAAFQKERDKALAGFAAEVEDHKRKVSGGKP